jgi:hypothetical protein
MRKGVYVPLYETEPDDIVNNIVNAVNKPELESMIATLRVERNIRIHASSIKSISRFSRGLLADEIHAQIACSGFGRAAMKDGKRIIKSYSHA